MTNPSQDPSRRRFLEFGAVVGGGLIVGIDLCPQATMAATAESAFQPSAFLRVEPGGTVTVFIGQSEMGQGVLTGLAQVVAEELDVDWENVILSGDGTLWQDLGAPHRLTEPSFFVRSDTLSGMPAIMGADR